MSANAAITAGSSGSARRAELLALAYDYVLERGLAGLSLRMGAQYNAMLADRISLLLQLQGFAACGDPEVRDAVRECFGRMWQTVAETTGLDPVTVKTFLAFGMLLNNGVALQVAELDEPWAKSVRLRIRPGLFEHITTETNR